MEPLYNVFELIGEGSFGRVFRARCNRTNVQVAYKVISKNGRSLPEVHALRRECEIQKSLWHPNIIRMLHSFENDEELVVITEFAQKDLCHILREERAFGEDKARKIVCDLVAALYYLHSYRILHRDLKPQNVLLDCNGNAKLCDFGFAKVLCKDSQMLTSIKGTPLYMAPELMQEHPYDHNADLWSLGCITYEMVTGHPPYTTSSILQLIKMVKLQPIKWPEHLSVVCLSFLKGLLDKNPACRLSWPYLLYHQFIVSHTWPNLPVSGDYLNWQTHSAQLPAYSQSCQPTIPENKFHNQAPEDNQHIPSPIIEMKDQHALDCDTPTSMSHTSNSAQDASFQVQKEEWLECLDKTISSLMYEGDVEEVIEKHSLQLIMNTFNTYHSCPIIVTKVTRLLSLPFVVETVSDIQVLQIKKTYVSCFIIRDLLIVLKNLILTREKRRLSNDQEVALQQIFSLICHLVFTDGVMLEQFFLTYVSLKLFEKTKTFLSIRTKNDSLSVVKYLISVFTRLYIFVPQSRPFISQAFEKCTADFHSLLRKTEDMKVTRLLCTFIAILGCTQPNFPKLSSDVNSLVDDLSKINLNTNTASTKQIINGTLEILKIRNHTK